MLNFLKTALWVLAACICIPVAVVLFYALLPIIFGLVGFTLSAVFVFLVVVFYRAYRAKVKADKEFAT